MSIIQILNLIQTERSEEEVMNIIDIMNEDCKPEVNGVCKKLVAIADHIDDRQNQVLLSVDNEFVRNFYEEEFWKHAPDNLKRLKAKLKEDPFNYNLMDKFSVIIKIYTYQIKYPWNVLPENPILRMKEKKRIIKFMSEQINYDSE